MEAFEKAGLEEMIIPWPARTIGDLLVDRRHRLGLSQRDLAECMCQISGRATVTRCEISRYERETRIPTSATLPDLATAIRLPVEALRQAAWFAKRRRRIACGHSPLRAALLPGYAIGTEPSGRPHPTLHFGADPQLIKEPEPGHHQ